MADSDEHDRIDAEISRVSPSSDPFAAAVRATRMPMLITDPNQPDNPIVFANAAFSKLTGYGKEEILGRNCRFLQGPRTDKEDVRRIREAVARRLPIEIEILNHKKNGDVFWNRVLISPVFGLGGQLTYFFASQFDVSLERDRLVRIQEDRDALEREVERRASQLIRSEDRLKYILKSGRFGAWTLDLGDMRLIASDICKENFGRDPEQPFGYDDLLAAVHVDDRARMQAAVRASIETRTDYDIEYRALTPEHEVRWLHIRGQTYYGTDGRALSMAGVSIDITERKRSEAHKALLTDELNHRVKNSIATMQSIAHQTLRNAGSLEEARDLLDLRLQSLASAHDILTREGWEGALMAEIVNRALMPFRTGQGERFVVGGPAIWLSPRMTLPIVMALHELSTNAVKYGSLSSQDGRVLLDWSKSEDGPKKLLLQWEEVGGPRVSPPTRSGFGSRLIERALSSELGGNARLEFRSSGVVFTLEAPLEEGG